MRACITWEKAVDTQTNSILQGLRLMRSLTNSTQIKQMLIIKGF